MISRAIAFVSLLLVVQPASAQDAELLSALLARAHDADSQTDYAAAIPDYEAYAAGCFALRTAVLERNQPCAELATALERAFELSRALGDVGGAERTARLYNQHLLYAQPLEAMRIGYELAQMHIAAGRLPQADAALAGWIDAHRDPPAGHAILVDAMRARIASAMGRPRRATMLWRRVERRFAEERDQLVTEAGVAPPLITAVVAEGRLIRAEDEVRRFLATGVPRATPGDEGQWLTEVVVPWRERIERRLLLARYELERVYELGSPEHSVIAAGRIGMMYGHYMQLYQALPRPQSERVQMVIDRGETDVRPGWDQARTHLETCVSWANHHGVARPWARRCEQALHTLDPASYPLPAELHSTAEFVPSSVAVPHIVR